jgi:beta-lactamase superfamily II metal-dependent hydrolase
MDERLTVTMFDVGFGDCFLVEIPVARRPFRILFDCGCHSGSRQKLADRVIAAVTDAQGNAYIDVVVGTHRHKDHVNGFAADGWEKVEVREVWLPWTENPEDPNARGLAARQVEAAALAMKALAPAGLGAKDEKHVGDLLGLALTNEAAMDTLYNGFAGGPVRRYLPDAERPLEPLTLSGFPGISFHVMGPTRDETNLGTMDPPKAETFRKLAAAAAAAQDPRKLVPFSERWSGATGVSGLLSAEDEATIGALSARQNIAALSAAIDNAINNTSLVIMIEVGKAFLLFCADAQWGNWQAILAEPHWRQMLRNTTFLKVGHHASHNASPVSLIDKLLPHGIPAMVSVETEVHNNVPYTKLMGAFGDRKYLVARSDEPDSLPEGYAAADYVIGEDEKPHDGRISLELEF